MLAQAEEAASRHFFSGTLYVAGRYDSNANAGPDDRVIRLAGSQDGTGILDPEDTEQSDYSGELVGSFSYAYALDSNSEMREALLPDGTVIGLGLGDAWLCRISFNPVD